MHLAMARAGVDEQRRMMMAKNAKSHTAKTTRMAFAREAKFGSCFPVFQTTAPLIGAKAHFIALLPVDEDG